MIALMHTFFAARPEDVAVLVMHSWSLSKQLPDGPTQTYDKLQPGYVAVFDEFLDRIAGKAQVVTAREVVEQFSEPGRRARLETEAV